MQVSLIQIPCISERQHFYAGMTVGEIRSKMKTPAKTHKAKCMINFLVYKIDEGQTHRIWNLYFLQRKSDFPVSLGILPELWTP